MLTGDALLAKVRELTSIEQTKPMTNTEQRHKAFLQDFTKLLRLYNAEFEMMDGVPEIFFNGVWNEDGDEISPHSCFNLPNYINPNR